MPHPLVARHRLRDRRGARYANAGKRETQGQEIACNINNLCKTIAYAGNQ